jgi:hypothetical protein
VSSVYMELMVVVKVVAMIRLLGYVEMLVEFDKPQ